MQKSIEITHTRLEEKLKFETLLCEISSRFVNVPAEEVDREIEDAQRRICELLDIDILAVWQLSNEDPVVLTATHYYSVQQGPQPPGLLKQEDFPWFVKELRAGRIVAVSSLEEMPAEAAHDREVCRQIGVKSNLSIPLSVGGGPLIGVMGFNTTRAERDWPDALVEQLHLIGQVFTNALARKRTELQLRQKTEELDHFFNVSLDLLCIANTDGYFLRLNPTWEKVLGYSREELMTKRFFDFVHPDDLVRTREAFSTLSSQQKLICFENCYRCKDGTYRWLEWNSTQAGNLIFAAARDISERKLAEQALEERSEFETLLAETSSRFVNLPSDRLDDEMNNAQRRICEFLKLDRSSLGQVTEGKPGTLIFTHIEQPQGGPSLPDRPNARELFPWMVQKLLGGETVTIARISDIPPEAGRDRESCALYEIKSVVVVPLSVGGGPVFGLLTFSALREERAWSETVVKGFELIAQVFANALARKRSDEQTKKHMVEIEELKQRLERENLYLQEEVRLLVEHTDIVGQSAAMKKVLSQAEQVAQTDSTVLLLGETGTGKELLARAIHSFSQRKDRPLVTVNCASLPPTLIESELFGREKGAYTGALTKMIGRFELADGSTLFLDEIGELPLELQSKLLRVLEEGKFERLGSTKPLHVNVRIIAATNRDIEREVKEGKFRRDLFYRLNVFPILIPPLREHREDIPLLVRAVVKEFQKRMGKEIENIPKTTMQALQSYSWPGNVRELRNLIEHAMILSKGKTLSVHVPDRTCSETEATGNLEDAERRHIVAVLEKTGWRIAGQGGAAEVLGLKRTTLQARMKKLGITRSKMSMPK